MKQATREIRTDKASSLARSGDCGRRGQRHPFASAWVELAELQNLIVPDEISGYDTSDISLTSMNPSSRGAQVRFSATP